MAGKYTGFDKLKSELATRPGVKDPGGLAAFIGRQKFGKRRFDKSTAAGKSMRNVKP